jgi:hypothetical protein
MKTADTQAIPAPPNLITALIAGFDTLTNQIGLILFPLVLDLFLWMGPRLSLSRLLQDFAAGLEALFKAQLSGPLTPGAPDTAQVLEFNRLAWQNIGERLNFFAFLRTYPVGIPSLMAIRQPVQAPTGSQTVLELPSGLSVFLFWLVFTLVGLVAGALYYQLVSQAALNGKVQFREALRQWPWSSLQIIALALIWAALALAVSIPGSCLLSIFTLGGLGGSPFGVLLFAGLLLWIFFPLFLSPHGIFVNGRGAWSSVRDSLNLSYRTFPQTSIFFLIALVLSQGLDVLWRIPAENSWLAVVGIVGHGFITTGILAASFIYYREADRWVQRVLQQLKFSGTHRI